MTLRRSLLLAIALLALLATGTVAQASHQRPPRAVLNLTITAEVGLSAAKVLTCQPTGGTHPKAAAACAELGRAGGDPNRLPNRQIMCTMEYAPVTATAEGHWRGTPVAWTRVFSNRCTLNAATGAVFQF